MLEMAGYSTAIRHLRIHHINDSSSDLFTPLETHCNRKLCLLILDPSDLLPRPITSPTQVRILRATPLLDNAVENRPFNHTRNLSGCTHLSEVRTSRLQFVLQSDRNWEVILLIHDTVPLSVAELEIVEDISTNVAGGGGILHVGTQVCVPSLHVTLRSTSQAGCGVHHLSTVTIASLHSFRNSKPR